MKVEDPVRLARERPGLGVYELARRLQIPEAHVRRWESGRSYPGKGMTAELERLSIRLDWTEGEAGAPCGGSAWAVELAQRIERLPAASRQAIEARVRGEAGAPADRAPGGPAAEGRAP